MEQLPRPGGEEGTCRRGAEGQPLSTAAPRLGRATVPSRPICLGGDGVQVQENTEQQANCHLGHQGTVSPGSRAAGFRDGETPS